MPRRVCLLLACVTALASAGAAAAADRFFSYDPANDVTRRVAGDLTFEFKQKLIWTVVRVVRSTEGEAAAELTPANEAVLGSGGLTRVIGADAHERDLYEVTPSAQGAEMIHAFCPGSSRAWMAFGRLAEDAPLRVLVIGDTPGGARPRVCQTLDFTFHGEWRLPPTGSPPPASDLLAPKYSH